MRIKEASRVLKEVEVRWMRKMVVRRLDKEKGILVMMVRGLGLVTVDKSLR